MVQSVVGAAPWVALVPLVWANLRSPFTTSARFTRDRDSL